MSSGTVIRGTPIAVDYWHIRKCPSTVSLFFLTHMHADHTAGLTPSWSQPIYCTPVTRKLLLRQYRIPKYLVRKLEIDQDHVVVDPFTSTTMTVTPIDASHCPGAAMFLFQGDFGRILYTGDFRFSASMRTNENFIEISRLEIDTIYLDNTYLNPECMFRPREEIIPEILEIIQKHRARVVIGLHNIGKEELLVSIAKELMPGEYIGVSPERMRILESLKVLKEPKVFQLESDRRCNIIAVKQSEITYANMKNWNEERRTIAIVPSALELLLGRSVRPRRKDVFVVPYSDHSSYDELLKFVEMLRPRRVVPILAISRDDVLPRTDKSVFNSYLSNSPPSQSQPSQSVSSTYSSSSSLSGETSSQSQSYGTSGRRRPKAKRMKESKRAKLEKGFAYIDDETPCEERPRIVGRNVDESPQRIGRKAKKPLDSKI